MRLPPFKVEVAVPWEVEEWSWPLPWWGVKVLEKIISTRQDTLAILNTKRFGPKNVKQVSSTDPFENDLAALVGASANIFARRSSVELPVEYFWST